MLKIFSTAIILIIACTSAAFSQIVINEVMYAPVSPNREWFELHNVSDSPVNIQNWKWKDAAASNPLRTISTSFIEIPPKSYLLVCEDTANVKTAFPGISGLLTQSAGWNALNNSGNENIVLYNSSGIVIDSLTYSNSWGGTGGKSLEKKIPDSAANIQSNWGSSADLMNATPLRKNSITPKPYDLSLKSFQINPLYPVAGNDLELILAITNNGVNPADQFSLKIYNDGNFDSIPSDHEKIDSSFFTVLNSGDSLLKNFTIVNIDTGTIQLIANLDFPEDEDTLNNRNVRRIFVNTMGSGNGGIVINEIMYDPLTGQSEWIEIYNASGQAVNLKNWKYSEASSFIYLSNEDLIFNPGDYFVLAHDSSVYDNFGYLKSLRQNQILRFSKNLSLSNSGETIYITDSSGSVTDGVGYIPEWNNPDLSDLKGISLERISPFFNSNDKNNWSSCAKTSGGTPCEINSIFTKHDLKESNVNISPNPFSPDGDGHEDFTLISYRLETQLAQMRVKVYDIKGRLVRTLMNNSISGSEGTIIFNGFDDSNLKLRTGIYILYIEAIDNSGGIISNIKTPLVIAAKM